MNEPKPLPNERYPEDMIAKKYFRTWIVTPYTNKVHFPFQ